MNTNINSPIARLIEANNQYSIAMNKPFTFAKSDDDNIPKNIDQSTFNNEREVREQPNEMDEDEFEVDDLIDRKYRDNVDLGDTDKNHFLDSDF